MNPFFGTGTALVTPFLPDFSVDFASLEKIVNHQIENGTNYLVMLGTTGEVATLTAEEKKQVISCIISTTNNRVPLVLGIGGNNTTSLVDQLKTTNLNGISAILSVSPYYNKPNQEGIFQHYKTLAENSPLPIIIYNVPGRTGSNITAETQLRIANLPNIIGTKEASGNMEQVMAILANKPADFLVISGDDALTFPMMALGAAGVISVVNHAVPQLFTKMVKYCLENNFVEARKLHEKTLALSIGIFEDGSPGGIKACLHNMGLCAEVVRAPLWNVNEQTKSKLLALLKSIG